MTPETLIVKGVTYRRLVQPFPWMAEAARFAKLLRENGYLAFRRGYYVYSAHRPASEAHKEGQE